MYEALSGVGVTAARSCHCVRDFACRVERGALFGLSRLRSLRMTLEPAGETRSAAPGGGTP
jgi:hypothetical protein